MENYNYVLKTNEAVLKPVLVNKWKIVLKNCIWAIVGVIKLVFIGIKSYLCRIMCTTDSCYENIF